MDGTAQEIIDVTKHIFIEFGAIGFYCSSHPDIRVSLGADKAQGP
jgi:hypothetical protein